MSTTNNIEVSLINDDSYTILLEKGGLSLTIGVDAEEIEDFTASQGWSFGWKAGMIVSDPPYGGFPAHLEEPADFIDRMMSCEAVRAFAKEFTQYNQFASMEAKEITLNTAAEAA